MAARTSGTGGGSNRPRPSVQASGRRASTGSARPPAHTSSESPQRTAPVSRPARSDGRASHASPSQRRGATPSPSRAQGGSSYNTPSLWTKDAPKASSDKGPVLGSLSFVGRVLFALLALVGRALVGVGQALSRLFARSRIALVAVAVLAVLLVGGLVDLGMNWGKAYAGVKIGTIDVAGKDATEMRALVEQTYAGRLGQGHVTVYSSSEAQERVADAAAQAEDAALAEQRSVEEARANKQLWTANASELAATLPIDDLVAEALAVGREEGGFGARLGALFGGWIVEARASYGEAELEAFAADIDATLGEARVDYNIAIEDGTASVTEGHDGTMLDREKLARELDQVLLDNPDGTGSFVAQVEHAPLRIDRDAAQVVCDTVNDALGAGARFTYAGVSWEATAADLGAWVATRIEQRGDIWQLEPYVDEARAKPAILAHVEQNRSGDAVRVTFSKLGDDVSVHTDGAGEIPLVAETARGLDAVLFGGQEETAGVSRVGAGQPVEVTVASGAAPETTSFDEAVALGLVAEISSYTTEYTNGSGTENRNHNIRLVTDLLNNSIAPSGGTWSFNGTSGECNAERGFLGAGAIIDGEYDDAVGGGICQVATTVFNAVYDAGFPVPTRHNHSLYIASYPAGRDAAVSWDELDLVWKNDSTSDVLMRTSYTDTSVTITLYGVDPGYRVSTDVGEWAEGEKHKTKTERDETMTPGTSYVKTAGTDGRTITVIRTVTSADGTVLHEDPFYSTYDPLTEVVIAGPETAPEKTDGAGA